MKSSQPKSLPFLSDCVLFLMNLIVTVLHLCFPFMSSVISTGMIGALFLLMLPPGLIIYSIIWILNIYIPQLNGNATFYVAIPLFVLYVIQILIIDTSHLEPMPIGTFRKPISFLQQKALAFWLTHFDYFPVTIHTSPNLKLPADDARQYIFAVHPHGIHCWPLNVLAFIDSPFDKMFPGLVGSIFFFKFILYFICNL